MSARAAPAVVAAWTPHLAGCRMPVTARTVATACLAAPGDGEPTGKPRRIAGVSVRRWVVRLGSVVLPTTRTTAMRPPRLPPPISLAPPRVDGPLSRHEVREARAVRLVAVYLLIAAHAALCSDGHGPIGSADPYAMWDWIRRRIRPLAAWSPCARAVYLVLATSCYAHAWYDAARIRRNIRALDRLTTRLAAHLSTVSRAPLRLVDDEPVVADLVAVPPPEGP